MDLRIYLSKNKIKLGKLAKELGISRTHLMDILHGNQDPRLTTAVNICKATNGQVTLEDIHALYAEGHIGASE